MPLPSSSQETKAPLWSSSAAETCPKEFPVLTRTGLLNVAPPSPEKTSCVRGESWASVYQAIATRLSFAAANAPLTGHALISHLSGFRIFDGNQRPFSKRMVAISRISCGVWSR